jgi:hypothetical protein
MYEFAVHGFAFPVKLRAARRRFGLLPQSRTLEHGTSNLEGPMTTTHHDGSERCMNIPRMTTTILLLFSLPSACFGEEPRRDPVEQPTALSGGKKSLDSRLLDGLGKLPESAEQSGGTESQGSEEKVAKPRVRSVVPSNAGSDTQSENPLVRIGGHMWSVERRLRAGDTSTETQGAQSKIIDELDELIAALAAQQPRDQGRRQAPASKQGQPSSAKVGSDAARDSTNRLGQADSAQQQTAIARRVLAEVWGHLPERYRRQMQNAGEVEFLPEYRKLIEDYYRRLAEDRGNPP